MKVAGCLNNNLSTPSFRMNIDFHPEQVEKLREDLPNYSVIEQAREITNSNCIVKILSPKQVVLRHVEELDELRYQSLPYLGMHTVDTWTLEAGGVISEPIKIPRAKVRSDVVEILIKAAKDFAQKCHDLRELAQQAADAVGPAGKRLLH